MQASKLRWPIRMMLAMASLPLLAACGDEPEDTPQAMAVTAATAQPREIDRSVRVSGPVAAYEEMQLGVELGGLRVTSLEVDVGQTVRAGQVLLTLDHRSLDSDLAQARASLEQAQASLALAQANYRRAELLAAERLVSVSQLDESRAARIQAEAQLATARAARDAAQLRRDFADLRAPAAGVISRRMVQPGQVVSAGSELLRLIRDGRLEWRAELPEAQLAGVQVGNAVRLVHAGQAVDGRIRAVSPGVDSQSRTGTVYADLPEPGPLRAGTYIEGRIVTGRGPALMVPAGAVVQRDGHSYVFVLGEGEVAQRRRVQTGQAVQDAVEILDGLAPGARVVVQGAGFLADGDRVRVVTDAAAAQATP